MKNLLSRFAAPITVFLCCLVGVYLVIFQPGYLTNAKFLGMLIALQVVIAAVWDYRQRFFPFLILVFVFAGTAIPLSEFCRSGRWFVLGLGAFAGSIASLTKSYQLHFRSFHLVAFSCVLAAATSSLASSSRDESLLKALGLLLLFVYGAYGARLSVLGREAKFFCGLLVACELLTYVTAISYFGLHDDLFGPNSLGAIMGVVVAPMMLWGVLVSERTAIQHRRIFAFFVSLLLLLSSYARAGILAAVVSCILLCFALRRYRLLFKFIGASLLAAAAVTIITPLQSDTPTSNSITSAFIYKGRPEAGVLSSRASVWDRTLSSVQVHPWFGTGFGTSATGVDATIPSSRFASSRQGMQEHGSSYLAMVEWVGLVGFVPFLALLFMVGANVWRSLTWMRRSGNPFHPLVPIAAVMAAGLVHAAFEDWLFATGYYLCVFFWALAFVLVDVLPVAAPALGQLGQNSLPVSRFRGFTVLPQRTVSNVT